jgi:Bacterial membrane protein YfhO
VAALVYLLVALVFVGPALLPGRTLSNSDSLWFEPPWVGVKPAELERPSNPELGDAPRHLQLFQRQVADDFPDVPLWNPAIVAGRPFHANAQSAAFGPFTWPLYVLPFWTALGWIAVLKLWVAAFGAYLLGRSLGMRFAAALMTGLVFAFSLKMVTWLSYPHAGVWALIPWLLAATDAVVRRPGVIAGAGLAAAAGLQFLCGHPESSFHALLAAVAFLALRLWRAESGLREPLLAFAGGVAGGAALAAVTLVPFAELLWLSADLRERVGESVDDHLPIQDALGFFLADWWGRPTQTPLRPFLLERALYVGALPLLLAIAALAPKRSAARIAVALFGAFWLAVALGVPPVLQVVTRLPVFNAGHNTRLVVLTMLALALLAGWGLDEFAARREELLRRRRLLLAAAAVLLVAPVAVGVAARGLDISELGDAFRVAWLFADAPTLVTNPGHVAVIGQASMIVWVSVAGAAAALVALRLGGRAGTGAFVVLALLLVCADLFRAGMGYNPAIERERAEVPATETVRMLLRQRPTRLVSTSDVPQNVIPMRFGLREARGYDLPIVRRFDRLWRREVDPRSEGVAAGLLDIPLELRDVTPSALRTLRLLGVTHVLQGATGRAATPPYEPEPAPEPLDTSGLTEAHRGPDARLYRVDAPLPRAWVVSGQRAVDGEDAALAAVTEPGFDPRREAIVEERLPGLPERPGPGGDARIVADGAEHLSVSANSPRAGVLVLADVHYPGWTAEVDGRETPVERVDYLLRGVRIPAGNHLVVLRYEPLSWTLGWVVSLVALILLAVAVGVGLSRRGRAG